MITGSFGFLNRQIWCQRMPFKFSPEAFRKLRVDLIDYTHVYSKNSLSRYLCFWSNYNKVLVLIEYKQEESSGMKQIFIITE